MHIDKLDESVRKKLGKVISGSAKVSHLISIDLTRLAAAAGCSTTLVRRHLVGDGVGPASALKIDSALGLRGTP